MAQTQPSENIPKGRKALVVGMGMVASSFIEKLFAYDKSLDWSLTVVGEEPYVAYNRVGLTQYFTHRSVENLYLQPPEWYSSHSKEGRLLYFTNDQVVQLDCDKRTAKTKNGVDLNYDICIFATGSSASLPPYITPTQFQDTHGVFVYRTVGDLNRMMEYAEGRSVKAVVVGGGLLGLEAAKALSDLDSVQEVFMIERNKWLLSRQLDEAGGSMLIQQLIGMGIQTLLNTRVAEVVTVTRDSVPVVDGLRFLDGNVHQCHMVVFAVGIVPRDDLAKSSNIQTASRRGIAVDDNMKTSVSNIYAIGECASWNNQTYGLIAPGIEMAEILAFNLTKAADLPMKGMKVPDLGTRLKLHGVDVACFGDYFADRGFAQNDGVSTSPARNPVQALSYHDPFGFVYKKYLFTADGKHILGGMMLGDISDYLKLSTMARTQKPLEIPPGQLILGVPRQEGESDGDDLDDSAQICSCYNVSKGAVVSCVANGARSFGEVKSQTKITMGCGGCTPLATSIFNSEMKKAGEVVANHLCSHFKKSRQDLFMIAKVRKLSTFLQVMRDVGEKPDSIGCEICKPAIASILSSLKNEPIMAPAHHQNQDTNDRYLANIQRNGTYSVIPRIPAGEITPAKLRVLGTVAEKYKLYTKITGGQRVDLFGASKQDLPEIWEELGNAGFESGHAYGKALRTVKSCVGTSWCRYGVGDSVGLAVELEERYKGIRGPHKLKGGVSGCVRECAEAQSKDFGVIATTKGWNVYVGGNGGAKPRHADLIATDVPKEKAVRIIDRFLMLYIQSADRLQRTARWIESLGENGKSGLDYLKRVVVEDSLGICQDLDQAMDDLVGTYFDEWAEVVRKPERRKLFRQFANTDETKPGIDLIEERGQQRPADWSEETPSLKFDENDFSVGIWEWRQVAKLNDLQPSSEGSTSIVINYSDTQIAVFRLPTGVLHATQQMCPHRRAFVLSDGLLGDSPDGKPYVSCPLHKRNFALEKGECLTDNNFKIMTFEVKEEHGDIFLKLPQPSVIDAVLGTSKWMVKQTKTANHGRIEIVGPAEGVGATEEPASCETSTCSSGNQKLDW